MRLDAVHLIAHFFKVNNIDKTVYILYLLY